jgi:hypothetical protein
LRTGWPAAGAMVAIAAAAEFLAASHPVDFFTDALRVGGRSTGFYAWIARRRPAAVGGWGLALGTVNVLAPSTRTIDLPDADPCAFARRERVALVAIAQDDRSLQFNARRLAAARRCGAVRYDDGIAVVVAPAGPG